MGLDGVSEESETLFGSTSNNGRKGVIVLISQGCVRVRHANDGVRKRCFVGLIGGNCRYIEVAVYRCMSRYVACFRY